MTAQVHDHSPDEAAPHTASQAARAGAIGRAGQPRWLWPGVAAGIVVLGLVMAGVVSVSTVLYFGLIGGMLLMHGGAHGGHGGHASHGGSREYSAHEDHGGAPASDTEALSHRSPGSQAQSPRSATGLDDRATNDSTASGTDDHDQHSSHGCH